MNEKMNNSFQESIYLKASAIFSGIIALAVVVYFIHLVKPLILYLLFAYFFVTLFRGTAEAGKKNLKLPKWITYIFIAIGVGFLVYLLTFIIGDTIQDLIKVQESYKDVFVERIDRIETWIAEIINIQTVDLRSSIKEIPIQPILTNILNNAVASFQVIFAFIVFMIAESFDNYAKMADRLDIKKTHLYEVLHKFQTNIQRYLVIKTFISAGTGIVVFIVLSLFNVDFALLWALLTFLLNYIPVIGSFVATILPFTIIFVTKDAHIILFLLLFLIGNQIFWGQFLDPKLIGDEFNLKFKAILVSIFLWGSLLGIGGVILSPLLTLVLKLLSEGSDNWKWFSIIVSRRQEHHITYK